MFTVKEHNSLKKYNTFGVEAVADRFIQITSEEDLQKYFAESNPTDPTLVLGEGSNILFTGDYKGLIIHPKIKGIDVDRKNENHVYINVSAGENWDEFVLYSIRNNWSGIENLSNIPGSVGACPVQNIGAYGVEIQSCIENVTAYELQTGKKKIFSNDECAFGYRSSIFKTKLKHQYIITQIQFKLNLDFQPVLNYGHLELEVKKKGDVNLRNIRDAVIAIRTSKLPDVKQWGNAGSFFQNPVIGQDKFERLQSIHGEFPYYNTADRVFKIPAAWLIEQCGFKTISDEHVMVHHSQPLVIINKGKASGSDILNYARKIIEAVDKRFSIRLKPEVNII